MLQASLHLSSEQAREWLAARRRLLEQMAGIRQRREKVALSLGLLLLQKKPVGDQYHRSADRQSYLAEGFYKGCNKVPLGLLACNRSP